MKSLNMKKLALTLTLLPLYSCGSSSYRSPESVESKIERYRANYHSMNTVPKIHLASVNLKSGRGPSSVSDKHVSYAQSHSNKGLYFLTLLSQREEIQSFIDKESEFTQSCPSFHSGVLKHRRRSLKSVSTYKINYKRWSSKIGDHLKSGNIKALVSQNPELALPISADNQNPTLGDIVSKSSNDDLSKHLKKALSAHVKRIDSELKELCEYGSSDNYYSFENLVGHYQKNNGPSKNSTGLETLFKTTLYSNMAILHSLKRFKKVSRVPASQAFTQRESYEKEVRKRTKAEWVTRYLNRAYR